MEQSNNTLPAEVVDEINSEADLYGFVVPYDGSNTFYIEDKVKGYQAGATEWATKLLEFQKTTIESDKQRKEASDELREAKKLLNEVFRKHEAGLLPDRFVYEKIKTFLYGE